MIDNVFGYPPPVWARFVAPEHAGVLDGDDVLRVRTGTPAARSQLELSLRLAPARAARFRAYGCPVTIAVGEWLAATLEREGVDELDHLDALAIRHALEIPEDRAHCAFMGEDLIRALRRSLQA